MSPSFHVTARRAAPSDSIRSQLEWWPSAFSTFTRRIGSRARFTFGSARKRSPPASTTPLQQDDLGPLDVLVRRIAIAYERLEAAAIGRFEDDGYSGALAPRSHAITPS